LIKGSRTEELPERISELLNKVRDIEKELAAVRSAQAMSQSSALIDKAQVLNGISIIAEKLVDGVSPDDLRKIAVDLKVKQPESVISLVSISDGKAVLVVAVSEGAKAKGVKAGALVKIGSTILGGGGGGKDDFAQGGGTNLSQIATALSAISDAVARG
jgi:alanyl-tRNA synthetase